MKSIPLSFQQRFHWDNARRLSDLNLNFPFALMISGALDIERLRESLERAIRRHAALRTRILEVNGEPRQVVDPPGHFRLEVLSRAHDLAGEVDAYLNRPFELVGGRLFRARLLRLSNRQHILLVCAHHLIMDAFSLRILCNELWNSYGTRSPRLPVLPIQYTDYALQQRQTHCNWRETHGKYWSERLVDAVPLRLPVERRVPVDPATSVGTFQIELEGALAAGIHSAARRWQTMPAMLMLTAFTAVLSHWSQQKAARDGMKLFSTSFNWLSMSAAELSGAPSQAVLSQLDGTLSLSPFPFRFLPRYLNGGGRPGQSDSSEVPATGLQVTQGIALEASLLYSSGSLSPRSMAELAASLLGVLEKAVA